VLVGRSSQSVLQPRHRIKRKHDHIVDSLITIVPEPDEVIFEERWAGGKWFRSGMAWRIGKGRVAYFRPGHKTFAVYKQREPLRVADALAEARQ
jgi:trehalose utilization protein